MLDPKFCYLLAQVRTKPSKPQPIVQKPCTTTEDDKPISMADAFNTFSINDYTSNK
jgi:hypothetical protein